MTTRIKTHSRYWMGIALTVLACSLCISAAGANEVVVYCAQDQVYGQAILREFEKSSGVRVRAVYDSEAVKTAGLANRLLAERSNPRCDVFWGNEEMRARQLAVEGVFREANGLALFGCRTRRIVVNTNMLAASAAPTTLQELATPKWKGKVALAYPLFGTTATHFHALRQAWGDAKWRQWCRGLASNKPLLLDGNSAVVKMVGRGEAVVGLTDSDDISAGLRQGLPIHPLPVDAETLRIPNTVGLVRHAPHPDAAEQLYHYLQRDSVAQTLVKANALENVACAESQPGLQPAWEPLIRELEQTSAILREVFLR